MQNPISGAFSPKTSKCATADAETGPHRATTAENERAAGNTIFSLSLGLICNVTLLSLAIFQLSGCASLEQRIQCERYAPPAIVKVDTEQEAFRRATSLCPPGGHVVHVLGTGSMWPTISTECFAVVKINFSSVGAGDICASRFSGGSKLRYRTGPGCDYLFHRVVGRWPMKDQIAWSTRGDNPFANPVEDSFPLTGANYGGTAVCFVTWDVASLKRNATNRSRSARVTPHL